MEFTKEVKQNWLKSLRSGKYHQIQNDYCEGDSVHQATGHCCLVVLDRTVNDMGIHSGGAWESLPIGYDVLVKLNDGKVDESYPYDYSNVIPFIEGLETVD